MYPSFARYYTRKEKSLLNTEEVTNVYKFLNREEGKRSLQTLKRKCVDNIEMHFLKKEDLVLTHLAREKDMWRVLASMEIKSLFS